MLPPHPYRGMTQKGPIVYLLGISIGSELLYTNRLHQLGQTYCISVVYINAFRRVAISISDVKTFILPSQVLSPIAPIPYYKVPIV